MSANSARCGVSRRSFSIPVRPTKRRKALHARIYKIMSLEFQKVILLSCALLVLGTELQSSLQPSQNSQSTQANNSSP